MVSGIPTPQPEQQRQRVLDVLSLLKELGQSDKEIADRTGVSCSDIMRLKDGTGDVDGALTALEKYAQERVGFIIRMSAAILPAPTTNQVAASDSQLVNTELPSWDAVRRELRWRGMIVKKLKQPSYNQEIILSAFQETGWPERVDDPLPPRLGLNPKQRLHDTIKRLNRNQITQLIHFRGDGTGRGILWEQITVQDL